MSKKKKGKKRVRAPKELTRKQRSRLEKERHLELIIRWGLIVIGVAVVGTLLYGFIVENVVKAREPVAIVDGQPIRTADFQARVRFVRYQMREQLAYLAQQQQQIDPTDENMQFYLQYLQQQIHDLQGQLAEDNALVIGEQTLNQMIQEELVRQEAARRGIVVSADELQQAIEKNFGYERNPATPTPEPTPALLITPTNVLTAPTATPLPTATPVTEEEFRRRYNNFLEGLKKLDISEQQYRSWVEASLLYDKVKEAIANEVPTTAAQVKLFYMVVDDEEKANELVVRLDAGEDPQTIADEWQASDAETPPGYARELDWLPRSVLEKNLTPEITDAAFSLPVGAHSEPMLSPNGTQYIVIKVLGREERELSPGIRSSMGDDAFQEWLDSQQEKVEYRTYRDRVPMEP